MTTNLKAQIRTNHTGHTLKGTYLALRAPLPANTTTTRHRTLTYVSPDLQASAACERRPGLSPRRPSLTPIHPPLPHLPLVLPHLPLLPPSLPAILPPLHSGSSGLDATPRSRLSSQNTAPAPSLTCGRNGLLQTSACAGSGVGAGVGGCAGGSAGVGASTSTARTENANPARPTHTIEHGLLLLASRTIEHGLLRAPSNTDSYAHHRTRTPTGMVNRRTSVCLRRGAWRKKPGSTTCVQCINSGNTTCRRTTMQDWSADFCTL